MQITKSEYRKLVFQSHVSANTKLVILAILEYMNGKDFECYPSMQTISIDCGLCRNSVLSAVKIAENEGLFSTSKKRFKGSKFSVTVYRFPFQCSPDEYSNEHSNDVSNERAQNGHKPLEPMEPLEQDIITQPKNRFDEFWDIFPRQRRGAKDKAETAYRKAIKRDTEDNILSGLKSYAESDEVSRGYAKGAAAWLNDDRWTSNYSRTPQGEKKTYSQTILSAKDKAIQMIREAEADDGIFTENF